MGLRYLGNIIKPGYNPLASNITTGVNVVQYQGVFTAQQQLQAQANQQWSTDPLFDYSTLLLQADGIANGSQNNTFLDSSTNNFTITRNGNTTQGTFSPFSATGWSTYFPGSAIVRTVANPNLAFGTGAITFECWINTTSASNMGMWGTTNEAAWTANSYAFNYYNGAIILWNNTTLWSISVGNLQDGNWHHIAIVRSGTTWQVFADGVSKGTTTTEGTRDLGNNTWRVATGSTEPSGGATETFIGYISNMRVSNTAIYTSNFTPSTTPLTTTSQGVSSSNVKFLSLQSNRFVDNSTNATTFTTYGTPSVQAFSPFAPQFQYTASVTGGSGYFDGSTDYLTVASNSAFTFTGDFTWEGWFYMTANPAQSFSARLIDYNNTGNFLVFSTSDGTDYLGFGVAGSTYTTTTALPRNQWAHVAVSRSGTGSNNLKLFLNGTAISTQTNTSTVTAAQISISNRPGSDGYFTGYMSSYRLTNTGLYTANFTPPTSPPTSASALLLNYTNAGILDGTMKNNLETVGNAQISTSVVKYGSGSMYFDGTGDYLLPSTIAAAPNLSFGTGDFTIEFWVYLTAGTGTERDIIDFRPTSTDTAVYPVIFVSTGNVLIYYAGGTRITGTTTVSLNTWYHVAVSRLNGSTKLYLNGLQEGSTYADTNNYTVGASRPVIGCQGYSIGANTVTGYMDDIRITKGIARYTQNFIPPSVALPRQ